MPEHKISPKIMQSLIERQERLAEAYARGELPGGEQQLIEEQKKRAEVYVYTEPESILRKKDEPPGRVPEAPKIILPSGRMATFPAVIKTKELAIERFYEETAAKLKTTPTEISKQFPLHIIQSECRNEIANIEKDYAAGITFEQVEDNIRKRMRHYEDPCLKCGWSYSEIKNKLLAIGDNIEFNKKNHPENLEDEEQRTKIEKKTINEITEARTRLNAFSDGCGINVGNVSSFLDEIEDFVMNSKLDNVLATRPFLAKTFNDIIREVLPDISFVHYPNRAEPYPWRRTPTLPERTIEEESEFEKERRALHDIEVAEEIRTGLRICPVCKKGIPFEQYEQHVREEHLKEVVLEKVAPRREYHPIFAESRPLPIRTMQLIPDFAQELLSMSTERAKRWIKSFDKETQKKLIDYLNETEQTDYSWLLEE